MLKRNYQTSIRFALVVTFVGVAIFFTKKYIVDDSLSFIGLIMQLIPSVVAIVLAVLISKFVIKVIEWKLDKANKYVDPKEDDRL